MTTAHEPKFSLDDIIRVGDADAAWDALFAMSADDLRMRTDEVLAARDVLTTQEMIFDDDFFDMPIDSVEMAFAG